MERQETKSRTGRYPDSALPSGKENSDLAQASAGSGSDGGTRYRKRALQIRTNLGEPDSLTASSSCRQSSFDLKNLLNAKENEYTRALHRIESITRSAISATGNYPPVPAIKSCRVNPCDTICVGDCVEAFHTISVAPRSVPSKKQLAPDTGKSACEETIPTITVKARALDSFDPGATKPTSEEPAGKETADAAGAGLVRERREEGGLRECKERLARVAKELREVKRKLAKSDQEHQTQLAEVKAQYEKQLADLRGEIDSKLLENNQDNELVLETAKGQLEEAMRKNETLEHTMVELKSQQEEHVKEIIELKATIAAYDAAKAREESAKKEAEEIRLEYEQKMEEMKRGFEEKMNELQESHIEGELASAVPARRDSG